MKKAFYTLLTVSAVFVYTAIFAQSSIFIKIDKIPGESIDIRYPNTIEAVGYSQSIKGCPPEYAGPGSPVCKSVLGAFAFQMNLDVSVIGLKSAQLSGTVIASVDVSFVKTTGERQAAYYKIHMENVLVTEVSESSLSDAIPSYYIQLSPQKIAWQYIRYNPVTGNVVSRPQFAWDQAINGPWNYRF